MESRHSRTNNLVAIQVLRCLAAVLVVVWHSHVSIKLFSESYWRDGDAVFRSVHYPFWANHFDCGVDIFFCISGFVMCMLADRTRASAGGTFLVDRFVRIWPPYWFFTLLAIAAYIVSPRFNMGELTGSWRNDFPHILKSLFLVPEDTLPVLRVGWTLVHEFLFYYFVAALIFLGQGKRVSLALAAMSVIGVVLCIANVKILYGFVLSPYYVQFFLGSLAYKWQHRLSRIYPATQVIIGVALYFLVSALLDAYRGPAIHMLIEMFGFGAVGFFLIIGSLGVYQAYQVKATYLSRLLARVGDASYSLYLSHWFVLSFVGRLATRIANAPILIVIVWHVSAIILAIVFSVLFAENIELPLHRALSDHFRSRRLASSSV